MNQQVIGFHQDEQGDWVADLGCGHGYHMRHNPPWLVREWVQTREGRERFIGHTLECVKCNEERAPSTE
jgi:tellurite methyltransferase